MKKARQIIMLVKLLEDLIDEGIDEDAFNLGKIMQKEKEKAKKQGRTPLAYKFASIEDTCLTALGFGE